MQEKIRLIMEKGKIKILFRTGGGKEKNQQLGLGHIYRTMNLGGNFKKNNVYFLIEDFGGVKKILNENGFKKIQTMKKKSLIADYNITKKAVVDNKIDVVVVDRYNIKPIYVKKLSKFVKTVIITDLKNIQYESALLVNGFVGFNSKKIINKFKTKCLVGPKYQILHKNFDSKLKEKPITKKIKILITFGGSDEKQIIDKILHSLEKFVENIEFRIIIGPVANKSKKVMSMSKKYPQSIIVKKNVKNMYKEMSEVNFGICSGGMTTYEFASTDTPFVIICDEHHQKITASEWHNQKIGINLGMINEKTGSKITKIIDNILKNQIKLKKGAKLVDGGGSNRIANEILKI